MQRRTLHPLLPALALFALGCEAPREPEPPEQPATAEVREARGAAVPGARAVEELHVVWPAEASVDRRVKAALPAEARAAVDAATVPVLVPTRPSLVARAKVIAKPAFTAVALQGDGEDAGLTISISATKIVHRHPGIDAVSPRDHVRGGRPAWVLMNEQVWSVTWEEHGVSYVVDLECARPSEDARCASPDAVLALVEDLRLAGGAGLTKGAAR